MATHEIKLKLTKGIEVLNTDVKIVVKRNGATFGTLTLSRGTIDWRPKKKHVGGKNEIQLGWNRFDKVMQEAKNV
jgi:hypothetical protein